MGVANEKEYNTDNPLIMYGEIVGRYANFNILTPRTH